MLPPSAETDAPEMLIGAGVAASRVIVGNDNLVRVTWLLAVNVSDCVTLGNVSVPLTRSTSVVPYASGDVGTDVGVELVLDGEGRGVGAREHLELGGVDLDPETEQVACEFDDAVSVRD